LVWLSNGGQWVASGNRLTNYCLEGIQFNAGPYTVVSNAYQTLSSCNSSCALNTFHNYPTTNTASTHSINSAYCFVGNTVTGGAMGVHDTGNPSTWAPYNLIVSANEFNLTSAIQWPEAISLANSVHLAASRNVTVAGNVATSCGRAVAFQSARSNDPISQQARIVVLCNDFHNSTCSSFFVQDLYNRLVSAEFTANRLRYGVDYGEYDGYGTHLALGTGTARPPTLILRGNEFAQGGGLSPLLNTVTLSGPLSTASGWKGLQFTVGSTPLVATYLGRWTVSGNTGTHTVQLFNASGQPLSGTSINTVSQPVNEIAYGALSQPIQLQANTTYLLMSGETDDCHFASYNTYVTLQGATGVYAVRSTSLPGYTTETWRPDQSYGPLDFICCLIYPAVGEWTGNPAANNNVSLNQTGHYYINSPSYWANSALALY